MARHGPPPLNLCKYSDEYPASQTCKLPNRSRFANRHSQNSHREIHLFSMAPDDRFPSLRNCQSRESQGIADYLRSSALRSFLSRIRCQPWSFPFLFSEPQNLQRSVRLNACALL